MRKLFVLLALVLPAAVRAQCILLPSAIPGVTLRYQNTALLNCSGVAYNTNLGLYYGVRAGNPSFPLETWSSAGAQLFTNSAGFDYRGMWWNPTLGQMEANGFSSSGIWRSNLNVSGYALNTGSVIFPGMLQPDAQSCGDLDTDNYEIIYYFSGRIYRYSRATGTFISSHLITGTPVALASLNSTTAMYSGCPGMEIALLDYVNKRVYFYNKSTWAYSGTCQLPASAVTTASFRTSWANGFIWLFDLASFTWYSFDCFDVPLAVGVNGFDAKPMGEDVHLEWETSGDAEVKAYKLMRSEDGIHFAEIESIPAQQLENASYAYVDASPTHGDFLYYQLEITDVDGNVGLSAVKTLQFDNHQEELVTFPNPVASTLNWDLQGCPGEKLELKLVDMAGRVILQQTTACTGTWDLSMIPNGVYLLTAASGGNTYHKQVVIQR